MMNGSIDGSTPTNGHSYRALKRYLATWDYDATYDDELSLNKGDILLVAEEFDDGWMRGLRLSDLEIGFFPGNFVLEDHSPIYRLQEIKPDPNGYLKGPFMVSSIRSKIALEIHSSEETYLRKLRLLNKNFVVPLSQNGVICPEDYGPVFSNIQSLISLSESFVIQLKSRMEGWDERNTRIADIFMEMGSHFKLFVTYAVQHTIGSQVLAKISAQEKFKFWLQKAELECPTLDSLLVEPIQRVTRYRLLLIDFLKHTPEEHPDYQALTDSLSLVEKIATDCNENVRRAENELKLFAISKRFPQDEVDIISAKRKLKHNRESGRKFGTLRKKNRPSSETFEVARKDSSLSYRSFFESEHYRTFIREGVIQTTRSDFTNPSERYLFLCSDVLVIAQPTNKSRKVFRMKERVLLTQSWVADTILADVTIPDNGFILGTPMRMYRFMASSVEEKSAWVSSLRTHIFAQKNLFHKLLSHLSIPDENFISVKARARVNLVGMLQEELSFKAGDEVAIVGFKDGTTGRWRPGLYTQEPFDPYPEWYYGALKDSYGWFPMHCVVGADWKPLDPTPDEMEPTPMCIVLGLKQRMIELTGRLLPPLMEAERTAKVYLGEGNFKTLRVAQQSTVEDVARSYFRAAKPDINVSWSLIEQSLDHTVHRVLDQGEDPSTILELWGKSRDRMRFLLKQTFVYSTSDSEA